MRNENGNSNSNGNSNRKAPAVAGADASSVAGNTATTSAFSDEATCGETFADRNTAQIAFTQGCTEPDCKEDLILCAPLRLS